MQEPGDLTAKLSVIVELTNLLRKETKILDIYQEITKIATDITHSERSSLFIYDKERNLLSSKIAQGLDEKISIDLDEGIAGYCGKTRQRIIENDAYTNPLFNATIDMQSGYRTRQLLAVPIIGKFDNLLGVLQVLNKKEGDYSENDADLLVIVAELAASVIEDHRIKKILKEEVDAKTKALQEANDQLGERVASEIERNRKLIEERQLQEELLIERSKLAELGKMIGFISHQMKQPLNVINVVIHGLQESYHDNDLDAESLDEAMEMFGRNITFLAQTIDDFRLFVKHDRTKEVFELRTAVDEILRLMGPLLRMNSITITSDVEAGLRSYGIANEFKQVIINLITNTIDQFGPEGPDTPVIKLIGRRDGGEAVLQVRDNAGGIDTALLPDRLFEPDVTTKGSQGTGLGLHMCRLIIEKHMEGAITAGNAEGGAEFTIRLPEKS